VGYPLCRIEEWVHGRVLSSDGRVYRCSPCQFRLRIDVTGCNRFRAFRHMSMWPGHSVERVRRIQWREELREHDAYIASLGCSLPLIRRFSKAFGQGNETVSSILQSLDRERNDNLAVDSTNVWMSSETCMDHEASNTHAVC